MANGIVTPMITIGLDAENKLTIVGPLHDKTTCFLILADVIKIIAVHKAEEPSKILVPRKPDGIITPGGV